MKAEVNKINKWNLTDHVNYFEQVYGARPITNLESVDQHHYDQNQMEWSNQAARDLYDIASYLDNQEELILMYLIMIQDLMTLLIHIRMILIDLMSITQYLMK